MKLSDNQPECAVDVMLYHSQQQEHGQLTLSRDDVIMMNTDLIFAGKWTSTICDSKLSHTIWI